MFRVAGLVLALSVGLSGCVQTHFRSSFAPSQPTVHTERQWFILGIPVSTPVGTGCFVTDSRSGLAVWDVLYVVGLNLVGSYLISENLNYDRSYSDDSGLQFTIGLGLLLGGTLVQPRTVKFKCGGPVRPGEKQSRVGVDRDASFKQSAPAKEVQ